MCPSPETLGKASAFGTAITDAFPGALLTGLGTPSLLCRVSQEPLAEGAKRGSLRLPFLPVHASHATSQKALLSLRTPKTRLRRSYCASRPSPELRPSPMHGWKDGENGAEARTRKASNRIPKGSPRPDPPLRARYLLVS
jgi:hypothetical protein